MKYLSIILTLLLAKSILAFDYHCVDQDRSSQNFLNISVDHSSVTIQFEDSSYFYQFMDSDRRNRIYAYDAESSYISSGDNNEPPFNAYNLFLSRPLAEGGRTMKNGSQGGFLTHFKGAHGETKYICFARN